MVFFVNLYDQIPDFEYSYQTGTPEWVFYTRHLCEYLSRLPVAQLHWFHVNGSILTVFIEGRKIASWAKNKNYSWGLPQHTPPLGPLALGRLYIEVQIPTIDVNLWAKAGCRGRACFMQVWGPPYPSPLMPKGVGWSVSEWGDTSGGVPQS